MGKKCPGFDVKQHYATAIVLEIAFQIICVVITESNKYFGKSSNVSKSINKIYHLLVKLKSYLDDDFCKKAPRNTPSPYYGRNLTNNILIKLIDSHD